MIQELLGANSSLLGENRKIPLFEPTPPPNSTTTNSPTPNPNPNHQTSTSAENLRCPRCESSNTKFCYYNNYNLTQPRHFCKSCRRYWTKGGALRNVPIGGGCRKNKTTTVSPSTAKSNVSTKLKTMVSEIGRSSYGFDHFPSSSSSPILWANSPQSSHLLSLLRVSQNPNPDLNNSFGVKEEGFLTGNLNHLNMAETMAVSGGRTLGFDPLTQVPPSLGLCSPIWKSNQLNGFVNGSELGHQNSGIQELYERLRSSSNSPLVLSSNVASTSSSSSASASASASASNSNSNSTILESSPVGGAELGYWNPTFSWSDLPTTNGAYPLN